MEGIALPLEKTVRVAVSRVLVRFSFNEVGSPYAISYPPRSLTHLSLASPGMC